jgi:chaperonin cofactor prefoldin
MQERLNDTIIDRNDMISRLEEKMESMSKLIRTLQDDNKSLRRKMYGPKEG